MILLDSHIWIWSNLAPSRLTSSLIEIFESKDAELAISAITIWETILAIQKGRIESPLSADQTARAWLAGNPVRVVPIDEEIAVLSRTLEFHHEDPADRFIAATAFHLSCPLATLDPQLAQLSWLDVLPAPA